jgi:hypothetical protein
MGLNEENHVTWTGCSIYDFDDLEQFYEIYGPSFNSDQLAVYKAAIAARERYKSRNPKYTITVTELTPKV